jgi:hypothetical protein
MCFVCVYGEANCLFKCGKKYPPYIIKNIDVWVMCCYYWFRGFQLGHPIARTGDLLMMGYWIWQLSECWSVS